MPKGKIALINLKYRSLLCFVNKMIVLQTCGLLSRSLPLDPDKKITYYFLKGTGFFVNQLRTVILKHVNTTTSGGVYNMSAYHW